MTRLLLSAVLLTAAVPAGHAAIAYSYAGPVAGNQTLSQPTALGLDFDVISSVEITELLAFDDDADGWTTGTTISVAIYDRDTQSVVIPYHSFSPSNSGTLTAGSYRSHVLVAPVTLPAGGHYSVVAQGYNAADRLYNSGPSGVGAPATDGGGGLISFTGTARNLVLGTDQWPSNADTGPANRYAAGSFAFQAVPEPGTAASVSCALLFLLRRRRA